MKSKLSVLAVALVTTWALPAEAVQLTCHEERGTMQNSCIGESEVRVNGDVRSAPLYRGGSKGMERTSYTVLVDCKRNVSTLQDSKGVNFAGGSSFATPIMRDLSQWMCDVPKPRKDSRLRQF